MASGGPRPGAGRKTRAEKYERPINKAEKRIADRLPELIDNLFTLANGGYDTGSDTLEPAGTVFVGEGEARQLAFPHLNPEQLVVVRQTRSVAEPDRAANQYLVDRILGKPTAAVEMSGPNGGPIEFDDLSDAERAARATAILELARARRAGQAPHGSEPE